MKNLDVDLVIIDFDETLARTEEATFRMENEIAESLGFHPMSREAHKKNWGIHIEEAIKERIPGIDTNEFMRKFGIAVSDYVSKGDLDVIPQENLDVLDILASRGKKLSILTSRVLAEVRHLLDPSHDLSKRIDRFYHKDCESYCKPDPRVFNKPLEDFRVKPGKAVYIGDSFIDGVSSTGAGLHFIASLESGLRTEEDFKGIPVDAFVYKFNEILEIIK